MRKKFITLITAIAFCTMVVFGCADSKVIDGKVVEPYGLIDKGELKDPDIRYSVSKGNIALSVCFFQTIVMPIYVFGFALYEPIEGIEQGEAE
ncbi:MAG: hypothetical protein GY861_25955 [bacterium]|nr:hypothetical protein [bacterium]